MHGSIDRRIPTPAPAVNASAVWLGFHCQQYPRLRVPLVFRSWSLTTLGERFISTLQIVSVVWGSLLVVAPAWAQTEDGGNSSLLDDLWKRLADARGLVDDPSARRYTAYIVGGIVLLWLAGRARRLLGHGADQSHVAAPSRSQNLRDARRAIRHKDYAQAGRFYEAAEDWGSAAEAYERGRAFSEAASVWERLNQTAKAARLYEQANDSAKAAELYTRLGNYARAAGLYQKGGQDIKAAEAYERAGEVERAAGLYAKHEVFDRAGDLLFKLGQYARAAEQFERALRRLVVRGAECMPEAVRARQTLARRCGELYGKGGNPARAAAVLREHGLEVEAAAYYCQAGDWETGLDLFLRH